MGAQSSSPYVLQNTPLGERKSNKGSMKIQTSTEEEGTAVGSKVLVIALGGEIERLMRWCVCDSQCD